MPLLARASTLLLLSLTVLAVLLAPLRTKQREKKDLERARTAATRVDFFTLVRGED